MDAFLSWTRFAFCKDCVDTINQRLQDLMSGWFVQEFSKILGSVCHCFFWIS